MNDIRTSCTSRCDYDEAAALQHLMRTIEAACDDSLERMQQHEDFTGQFTINILGQSIAFYLGGPQTDALYAFIEHIAAENFHEINYTECSVTDSLIK